MKVKHAVTVELQIQISVLLYITLFQRFLPYEPKNFKQTCAHDWLLSL
jgi:hypothetical protein